MPAPAPTSTNTTAFGRYGIVDRTLCDSAMLCPDTTIVRQTIIRGAHNNNTGA